MMPLAWSSEKGIRIKDMEYRIGSRGGLPCGKSPDDLVIVHAKRIGIEKRGDFFALFVSMDDEPMHQFGAPIELHIDGLFYAVLASACICRTRPIPLHCPMLFL